MDDERWTRVSAHGLCIDGGSILLVRLAPPLEEAGLWGLPGGGLDWGEHPEIGLAREFVEETGLEVVVGEVAGVYSDTYPRSSTRPRHSLHFISVVYWVTAIGRTLVHEVNGTTDLAAWVSLATVDDSALGDLARFGRRLVQTQDPPARRA